MSLDIFAEFATDENLELNGTWVPMGKGCRLLIARSMNRNYLKEVKRLVDLNQQILDLGNDASEAKDQEIRIEVMSKTILLGWEGLSFKGQDLPYTTDNARMVLGVKDFRERVAALSQNMEAYKVKLEKAQGEA